MTSLPPNTTWLTLFLYFSLKMPASLYSHVVLDPQHDIAHSQYDMVLAFSLFFPQIAHFLVQPRRIGPPTRHRTPPIRRGSRFSYLFASKCLLPCTATSRWTSNATWHTSNTTWLSIFLSFCLKLPASLYSHVALGLQRDMAAFQHDVAPPLYTKTTRTTRVVLLILLS